MTKIKNQKQILEKYKIRPSKRLGQNFLIDENILKKIIEAADLSPQDIVLEIGPGLGVLTVELAKRVKQVIAIEKDRALYQLLGNILKSAGINNVKIINKDVLQISNSQFLISNYKIIANLPYYITSPVIRKFLETENKPELMILMVQKEVAQRICPPRRARSSGEAGAKMNLLAISVQFYAEPEIISYVSKNSFWPQPKVDSAIIKIVPKDFGYQYPKSLTKQVNPSDFFQLVKTGFSSKRKMLKNNLKIDESILKKMGLNPKIRAENLSINDWLKLYYEIGKN